MAVFHLDHNGSTWVELDAWLREYSPSDRIFMRQEQYCEIIDPPPAAHVVGYYSAPHRMHRVIRVQIHMDAIAVHFKLTFGDRIIDPLEKYDYRDESY